MYTIQGELVKNNLTLKKTSIILITLLGVMTISASCRLSKAQNNDTNEYIGNMAFPKERLFIQSELIIGRRICAALKLKRENFTTRYEDKQEKMRFQGTLLNCEGNTTLDTPFDAFLMNATALEYLAIESRENYFRDIVTDQSGAMNDICLSLFASDNVLNTFKSGSVRYTVNFLIDQNYDRYDVRKELNDGKGNFTIANAERVLVVTQKAQAAETFFGVEKERERHTSCGGKKFKIMKQAWKGALTKF